jgi:hypothetical protein
MSNTLEKIYAIIDAIEPDEYGCLNYPGMGDHGGYRIVSIEGKRCRAHRVALERKLGRPIRPGYDALHECDWPPCVNEDHLYEGTDKDNMRDKMKLTPEEQEYLKQLLSRC